MPEEALEVLTKQATTKVARREEVKRVRYPAYVMSLTSPLTCLREGDPRARAASKERTRGQRRMCLIMIDANQVWDVPQAIVHVKRLAEIRPWFIEGPTALDECVLLQYLSAAFAPSFLPMAIAPHD